MKVKDEVMLQAMVPHSRKFMECYRKNFTYNITILCYKQVLGIKWRMLYDCECYIVVRILLMIIKGQQRNLHDECLESSWNYDNEH
jgi:hypothetical protein